MYNLAYMLWNLQDSYKVRKGTNKSPARLTKDYNTPQKDSRPPHKHDPQAKLRGYPVKLPSLRQFLSIPNPPTPQSPANNPTLPKYDVAPPKQNWNPAPEATLTLPTSEHQVYNIASPTLNPTTTRKPPRSITRDHEPTLKQPKANNYSEEQLLRQIELLPQTNPNLFREKSMLNLPNGGMPQPPPPLHIVPPRATTPPAATPLFLAYQNLEKWCTLHCPLQQ